MRYQQPKKAIEMLADRKYEGFRTKWAQRLRKQDRRRCAGWINAKVAGPDAKPAAKHYDIATLLRKVFHPKHHLAKQRRTLG